MTPRHIITALTVLVFVFALGAAAALYSRAQLQERVAMLRDTVEQQEARAEDLEGVVTQTEEQLEAHKELIRALRQQSAQTAYDFSQIRQLVEQATSDIGDIRKLEEADEELLAKYSKVYFLNEHYVPENLVYIPNEYVTGDRQLQVKEQVRTYLADMLAAMEATGLEPRVLSAYRSFNIQEDLKHRHQVTYGTTEANRFVADQGYSEHQLGTTVDITNTANGGDLEAFDETPEYQWLQENAHRYGFTLSYPEDNAYYAFEPWHWRFVGIELATHLHDTNQHFYDLPQREINEYRLELFDQ